MFRTLVVELVYKLALDLGYGRSSLRLLVCYVLVMLLLRT